MIALKLDAIGQKFPSDRYPNLQRNALFYDRLVKIVQAGIAEVFLQDLVQPRGDAILLRLLSSGYVPIGEADGAFEFVDVL
jgi:hypothetical protein